MSIIFYHNDHQKNAALTSKTIKEKELNSNIFTEIIPYRSFYAAEDYHQKYYLQMYSEIFSDLKAVYTEMSGIIDSTAAARINGYLGGNGTYQSLEEQIELLGLSESVSQKLLEIASQKL
jgi:peptide-methionine (S)-S-oxide reductase